MDSPKDPRWTRVGAPLAARAIPGQAGQGRHESSHATGGGLPLRRVIALAVIGVFVLGLTLLKLSSGDSRLAVPAGAKAGDLAALHSCSYATDTGSLAADCGTLVVPENRRNPNSRLIALPVTRIHATGAAPEEPVFRLQGGPGITNMNFSFTPSLVEKHDVVLVGYRGIDGSVELQCPEVISALRHSPDLVSPQSFDRYTRGFKDCAHRLAAAGIDLDGYSLPQRVDDMEAARKALGYQRIDLISESAGTRTAMIYAARYPESIRRSVMIAVNPPGHYFWDGKTTDDIIGQYATMCAADSQCSNRTSDLAATMRETAAHLPSRWLFLPIKSGNVRAASHYGLFETTKAVAPLNASTTFDAWLAAAKGDPSGLWLLSITADLTFPGVFVWGEFAATGVIDADAARTYFAATGSDDGSILGNASSEFDWGGGGLAGAWPASPDYDGYRQLQSSSVETLLISGELDTSTPARFATKELLPTLANGKQVILHNFGHTEDFWNYHPDASARLVNSYFSSGTPDSSLYPEQRVTFDPGAASDTNIAKIVLAIIATVFALSALLLAWMTVHMLRGHVFGWKTSVVLRAFAPIFTGLAAFLLTALVILTAWPASFIGGHAIAAVPVGVAAGLTIYLGWFGGAARGLGLAAAVAGGVLGAWLGFAVSSGFASLATAIIGATLGANLLVLTVDVLRPSSMQAVDSEPLAPAESSPA